MKHFKGLSAPHPAEIDERFHQLNYVNVGSVVYWADLFGKIAGVPGDVVECGVGRGRSLLILAVLNDMFDAAEGGQRRLFGYDSFAGFPEPAPQDASPRQPKKGEWAASPSGKYDYTPDFIRRVLRDGGVDDAAVTLTPGFFQASLASHPDRPIALLHVDGDLYSSYMATLTQLYPKVAPGGLVVFDDFLLEETPAEAFPGARKAVKEFFGDDYRRLQPTLGGNGYIQKR
jgi:hypothetical protein